MHVGITPSGMVRCGLGRTSSHLHSHQQMWDAPIVGYVPSKERKKVTNVNSDQWTHEGAQDMSVDREICNHAVKHEDCRFTDDMVKPVRKPINPAGMASPYS